MKVKELPLPEEFTTYLDSLGFVELFPPQAAAVEAGPLEGRNLLVASPTARGTTLIAALAAFKRIGAEHRTGAYPTPPRAPAPVSHGTAGVRGIGRAAFQSIAVLLRK